MLKCPACDNTLDQDFGMITCNQCQAVLMIDISGQVQMGSDSSSSAQEHTAGEGFNTEVDDDATDPPEESITEPDNFESVHTLDSQYQGQPIESEDQFQEQGGFGQTNEGFDPIGEDVDQISEMETSDEVEVTEEPQVQDHFFEDAEDDPEETVAETSAVYSEDTEEDTEETAEETGDLPDPPEEIEEPHEEEPLHQTDFADDTEEVVEAFEMPAEPDPDPVDITSYANSETSNLEEGEFVYDVFISRLDSKDLKDALKYVLIDEKLQLNHHEFLKAIKDGAVTIPNLNPIKAKRIVEQLQYFSLEISWKQKRVVMEMVETEVLEEDSGESDEIPEDVNV